MKNYIECIKKATAITNGRFSSWDLGKYLKTVDNGVRIEFDILHRDEIEFDDIIDLTTLINEIKNQFKTIPGTMVDKKGITLYIKGVDIETLYADFVELCKEEYKANLGITNCKEEDFSIFQE